MMYLKSILLLALCSFLSTSCTSNSGGSTTTQTQTEDQADELVTPDDPESVLANTRYSDPNNFFKIVPPADWRIEQYPQEPRGKVAFFGPDDVELRILAKGLDYDSFEDMVNDLKGIEKRISMNTNMEKFMFFDIQAVKRQFTYNGLKILFVDLMIGNTSHNLMYSALPGKFGKYESIAWESINTYEPILREVSPDEVKKHSVAKSVRLTRIFIDNKEYTLAETYLNEGLDVDPESTALLELQKELEAKK